MRPTAWMYIDSLGAHYTDCESDWYNATDIEEVVPLYAGSSPCRVFVKDLCIVNSTSQDKVWIGETDGGEGGDFSKDRFYEVLRGFYDKEF